MKRCLLFVGLFWVLLLAPRSTYSAAFQNLGFDAADTNHLQDGFLGTTADLLPGWALFSGDRPVSLVRLNLFPIGLDLAILYDQATAFEMGALVEDRFSLTLLPDLNLENGQEIPFTLRQQGEIPPDAKSIRFLSYFGPMELTINGSAIPLHYDPIRPSPLAAFGAGDISAFAGQQVDLEFHTPRAGRFTGYGLDSIRFSPEIIPEPGTGWLVGCGILAFSALAWHRRKRSAEAARFLEPGNPL